MIIIATKISSDFLSFFFHLIPNFGRTIIIISNPSIAFSNFRNNLRKYRKARNFTQERLAEIANIDPRYYRKIESGENNPTIIYAYFLAEALEVSLDELFQEKKK